MPELLLTKRAPPGKAVHDKGCPGFTYATWSMWLTSKARNIKRFGGHISHIKERTWYMFSSNDTRHDGNNLRGGAEASQVSTSIVLNLAKEKTVTTWKKHQQAQNIAYSGVFLKSTTHPSADKGGIDQAPCQKCLVVQRAAKRPFGPPYLRWNFA